MFLFVVFACDKIAYLFTNKIAILNMGGQTPKQQVQLQHIFKKNPQKFVFENKYNPQDVVHQHFQKILKNPTQQTKSQTMFKECCSNDIKNRALGCLFGSFIGDSLGAYCQFSKSISSELLDKTMQMPGGGVFNLKRGQYTDDSQLAYHLLSGILNELKKKKQPLKDHYSILKSIAFQYVKWMDSKPFDIGHTCRKGINKIKKYQKSLEGKSQETQLKSLFDKLFQQIYNENKDSQSNGSLMRITPMAVFFACSGYDPTQFQTFIKDQIRLMHSNQNVQQAGYLWVCMLVKIITRKQTNPLTFKQIYREIEQIDDQKQLASWFQQSKQKRMPANDKIGWAKIAWTYGMGQLYKLSKKQKIFDAKYFYEEMRKVIGEAGDTDTNAAIMGGLLGSLIGFTQLPGEYIKIMLKLEFPQPQNAIVDSQRRPHHYEPLWVFLDSMDLIDCSSSLRVDLK